MRWVVSILMVWTLILSSLSAEALKPLPIEEPVQEGYKQWVERQVGDDHGLAEINQPLDVVAIGRGAQGYLIELNIAIRNSCVEFRGVKRLPPYPPIGDVPIYVALVSKPELGMNCIPQVFEPSAEVISIEVDRDQNFHLNGVHYQIVSEQGRLSVVDRYWYWGYDLP